MYRNIILTLIYFLLIINTAFAKIDVVHPSSSQVTINASSVFFTGNTDKGSSFYINSTPVKLWNNSFFVHVVPLEYGKNIIKLTSKHNGKTEEAAYTIIRNKPAGGNTSKTLQYITKNDDEVLYTKTIKENATIREKASSSSKRVVDLPLNVVLYLDGQQGDYYKIAEQGNFWIHKSNIKEPVSMKSKMPAKLKKQKFYSDKLYDYTKFYLSHPVLYTLEQNGNSIILTLYGVDTKDSEGNTQPFYTYKFNYDTAILGYDCYYDDSSLIFRRAKLPETIDEEMPLKELKIFVDAGHGGYEKGAVGPSRVNEKDINLDISRYLVQYLKDAGADVIISRSDDSRIGLYERVKIAKDNNALISVSIHNNSLPNGKNPYETHGTEVHYYNENAKLLSEIININLSNDLNLKNNGVHKSSFALNRSTNPVSVLVECAYMINPEEYILLQNEEFKKNIAKSIKNSIEKYIIQIKN
ncbi:MAG: N-acetylmuramoyl-L-alanine amidase [Candidatus Gastranaerophilales bacterium]|nr:N-acetylmuramoyl-L-alanine amidase [Candidatus Gastranaerophilales bacterium]